MSRAGDKDEGGQGGSIAQFADAARRRTDRPTPRVRKRPRAKPTPPDPDPGTGLLTNICDEKPDRPFVESADDVLDRVVSGHQDWSGQQRDWLSSLSEVELDDTVGSPPEAPECEYDDVREQLEHHHEHRPARRGTPLQGSADLRPRLRHTGRGRLLRRRDDRPTRRVSRSGFALAAVAILVVAAVAVGTIANSGARSGRRSGGRPATVTMAAIDTPTTVAEDITRATTALGARLEAQAQASAAAEAKARRRAQTVARAAARARVASARRRHASMAREHQAAAPTVPTPTTAQTSPTTTSTASSSPNPSSRSTRSTQPGGSSTSQQPAFGSSGALGPGRSSSS
jgi:hypothetical protein